MLYVSQSGRKGQVSCYVCGRVIGVKEGRVGHLELLDHKEQQDLK